MKQESLDFSGKSVMMKTMDADEYMAKGLHYLQEQNTLAALSAFEKAYLLRKTPVTQSYYGACIAMERGQTREAFLLCQEALEQDPGNPVCYLNLGKVHVKAERKSDAIMILRQGLARGDNAEIRLMLEQLGVRQKPFFPFLPRSHFLNKYAGIAISRLRFR